MPNFLIHLSTKLWSYFRNLFATDHSATEKFVEGIINHLDLQTGSMNFEEFLVLMVQQQGVEGVQNAFLSYDVDGSGSISRNELKGIYTFIGIY